MTSVYVVMEEYGTCPSDAMEWVDRVFESKADADKYVAERPRPVGRHSSGPYYEVVEKPFVSASVVA